MVFAVAMAAGAWPARACLNDRYTEMAEKEFRSRYEAPAREASRRDEPMVAGVNVWGAGAAMVGAGLTASGMWVQLRGRAAARERRRA